jgi:hypothetical protein
VILFLGGGAVAVLGDFVGTLEEKIKGPDCVFI